MAASERHGSYQLYASGTNSDCHPTNGMTGAYGTAGVSILLDATKVILDGALLSPILTVSETATVVIKRTSDDATLMTLVSTSTDSFAPTSVDFGPRGIELDDGFYVNNNHPEAVQARVFFRVFQRTT